MLNLVHELLRNILTENMQGLRVTPAPPHAPSSPPVRKEQVGFRSPADRWVYAAKALRFNALNVCLADLRENCNPRSNELEAVLIRTYIDGSHKLRMT
jgi:hypothetical protein